MKYCFVCVCQEGELEIQSLLLMASLKRHLKVSYDLHVAIPTPEKLWGKPGQDTLRQLEAFGVKCFHTTNEISYSYPIANKLGCFRVNTDADRIVFLDSDMIFLRNFIDDPIFRNPVCVRSASLPLLENDMENWKNIYRAVNINLPETRILAVVSKETMLPYYNAGFIAIDSSIDFSTEWIKQCKLLDSCENVKGKRPYLDQIALPLAAAKLGINCTEIDMKYNFPPRLQQSSEVKSAIIYHYNNPDVIMTAPQVILAIRELAGAYPIIKAKMLKDKKWQELLENYETEKISVSYPFEDIKTSFANRYSNKLTRHIHRSCSNVIITGIPRSGSSLFTTLINHIDNVVCLNEVRSDSNLFEMYRSIRNQIISTQYIENKVNSRNELTSNTIGNDIHIAKIPITVDDKNFLLAQKFTLRYMVQLEKLIQDNWEIWAIVRHPVYTLSSWMHCPDYFPITQISPPNRWFHEVAFSSEDDDLRRIDIWNHLAEKLYENRHKINLVKYEDLVADPEAIIVNFANRYGLKYNADNIQLASNNSVTRYSDANEERVNKILSHAKLDLFDYSSFQH